MITFSVQRWNCWISDNHEKSLLPWQNEWVTKWRKTESQRRKGPKNTSKLMYTAIIQFQMESYIYIKL